MPEFRALLEGYHRFRDQVYPAQRRRWDQLAEGQEPPLMLIGCCDSRVDPAMIFDTGPGEVFVLRNVANLVPPYETSSGQHSASAAIEFGVTGLEVRHIVVMGHAKCGGIAAALRGEDMPAAGAFIHRWMDIIRDSRNQVAASDLPDKQRALELEAIKVSLRNLRTFPYVREREEAGLLKLHGVFFGIADGVLHVLDETSGRFNPA